ncbi:MAG: Omp28-related outer membrane protein [Bacteroidales bacterium]|nr:Omp28-related outer membrane protein [Bacteroidales bacterium]
MKKSLLFIMLMVACIGLFAQHTISIALTTDRYGSETTWEVQDQSTNSVIANGGPYTDGAVTTINIPDIDVDGNGCYLFIINDSYGDGICCSYGNGSYSVSYDGTVMGSGGSSFSQNIHALNPSSSACPADEITLASLDMSTYPLMNTSFQVKGKVVNSALNAITSYKVRYKLDGGEWSADYNVTCNIAAYATGSFTHNVPATFTTTGHHTIEVEVREPNGATDEVADNTLSMEMIVNENSVSRRPLLEHFSTAQCPNCPPAHTNIENWLSTRPEVIHLIHHCGYYTDDYTVSASQSLMTFYNAGGSTYAPAVMIDRMHLTGDEDPGPVFFPSASITPGLLTQRINAPAFVSVHISGSYDPTTRNLSLTVSGETVGEMVEQNLRLSVYIMEDGLIGSQSGASGNYTHDCVMRDVINNGGVWGEQNVVSATVGSTYSKTYSYTVNSNWNVDNLTVIAFVNNHDASNVNNRAIMNANAKKINDLSVGVSDNNESRTTVYPNPATDVLNVLSENSIQQVEIYNAQGQLVKASDGNVESISISNLTEGLYFVKVITDNGTSTHKIIKK